MSIINKALSAADFKDNKLNYRLRVADSDGMDSKTTVDRQYGNNNNHTVYEAEQNQRALHTSPRFIARGKKFPARKGDKTSRE